MNSHFQSSDTTSIVIGFLSVTIGERVEFVGSLPGNGAKDGDDNDRNGPDDRFDLVEWAQFGLYSASLLEARYFRQRRTP